jgi:hypothetical protein
MSISTATVAVWLAFAAPITPAPAPQPAPAPAKCCSKCAGTGMVPTGDGVTRVWCDCPTTCPCAAKRPKPGVPCKDGSCNNKRQP